MRHCSALLASLLTTLGPITLAATDDPFQSTDEFALIPDDAVAVRTIAGTLAIEGADIGERLALDGRPIDVHDDYVHLVAISHEKAEDLVLVATECAGSACSYLSLAFLRLARHAPPVIETMPDFSVDGTDVESEQELIEYQDHAWSVPLGVFRGMDRTATIAAGTKLAIKAVPVPITPLAPEDCEAAAALLEECASFAEPCAQAASPAVAYDCPEASMAFQRELAELSDHTTGLNLPRFAAACVDASQSHRPPDAAWVKSTICTGADPAQWAK
jgi:hypothetical protein